jgi:hypothetical protein
MYQEQLQPKKEERHKDLAIEMANVICEKLTIEEQIEALQFIRNFISERMQHKIAVLEKDLEYHKNVFSKLVSIKNA